MNSNKSALLRRLDSLVERGDKLLNQQRMTVVSELIVYRRSLRDAFSDVGKSAHAGSKAVKEITFKASIPVSQFPREMSGETNPPCELPEQQRMYADLGELVALARNVRSGLESREVVRRNELTSRTSPQETKRQKQIAAVIARKVRGIQYCTVLDNEGIKPLATWIERGCPANYSQAYHRRHWRQAINREKSRIDRKFVRGRISPRAPQLSNGEQIATL
jgi:hypothetical protein